jgi:hypothetical protein
LPQFDWIAFQIGDAIPSGLVSARYIYAYFTEYLGNGGGNQKVVRTRDDGTDPPMKTQCDNRSFVAAGEGSQGDGSVADHSAPRGAPRIPHVP